MRPKPANDALRIVAKDFFAAENVDPGKAFEEAFRNHGGVRHGEWRGYGRGGRDERFGQVVHVAGGKVVHRLLKILIVTLNQFFTFSRQIT